MQVVINAIEELKAEVGKPAWEWEAPPENAELKTAITEKYAAGVTEAYQISEKVKRYDATDALRQQAIEQFVNEESNIIEEEVAELFGALEKSTVRNRIIEGEPRIDGRDTKSVRSIHVETVILPKTHGSALFTRGETQALVITTLGPLRDAQIVFESHLDLPQSEHHVKGLR
jgi:polyribonucleotide nucleotidyltransferase